jgi:hydrogenase maturation protein HypF
VEHLARTTACAGAYPFPFVDGELDFRPLFEGLAWDRRRGRDAGECARAFQRGVAEGLWHAIKVLCGAHALDTVVLSGGVFQNELLLEDLKALRAGGVIEIMDQSGRASERRWNQSGPGRPGGVCLRESVI